MTSAASGVAASEYPSAANRPSISSESLTFIWQPYVSTYTLPFGLGVAVIRREWRPVDRRVRKAGLEPSTRAAGADPRGPPEDNPRSGPAAGPRGSRRHQRPHHCGAGGAP